jgi:hypothetical protein
MGNEEGGMKREERKVYNEQISRLAVYIFLF